MGGSSGADDYAGTQAWRLGLFFLFFCIISVLAEHTLHTLEHYFERTKRHGLKMTLHKFKEELMLLGFISMVLTIFQDSILAICVPASWDDPGSENVTAADADDYRRRLAGGGPVECDDGMAPFISVEALHQVHIFIFIMGVSHILFGCISMLLCLSRLHTWRHWEHYVDSFNSVLGDDAGLSKGAEQGAPSGHRRMSISSLVARLQGRNGTMTAHEWVGLDRHGKCGHCALSFLFGIDAITYLYLRRYFIRKHRRKGSFNFHWYVTLCTGDEFPHMMELTGLDWILATCTVVFRDYFFTIWASSLSLCLSVLVGIKLNAVARMIVNDARSMVIVSGAAPPDRSQAYAVGRPSKTDVEKQVWAQLQQEARTKFEAADDNSSGSLSKEEVVRLVKEIMPSLQFTDDYMEKLMHRFDMDDTGQIELDEFISVFQFLHDNKGKTKIDVRQGRVRWLCCACGPSVHPSKLYKLIRIIMFQNALVIAMVIFNSWQLGTSTAYFNEPEALKPAGGHVLLQSVLAVLQLLHTSFLTLPMFAVVKQMGEHYNARIFGDAAGKLILNWVGKSKAKAKAKLKGKGNTIAPAKVGVQLQMKAGGLPAKSESIDEVNDKAGGPSAKVESTNEANEIVDLDEEPRPPKLAPMDVHPQPPGSPIADMP